MKQILHLVPFQNFTFLFFDKDLLFPRIRALQATFKAVLLAVYMKNGLQTKRKSCFGGTRMILHALWKNTFSKKQYGFFTTLADPPPPGLAKDHKNTGFFFSDPFPYRLDWPRKKSQGWSNQHGCLQWVEWVEWAPIWKLATCDLCSLWFESEYFEHAVCSVQCAVCSVQCAESR